VQVRTLRRTNRGIRWVNEGIWQGRKGEEHKEGEAGKERIRKGNRQDIRQMSIIWEKKSRQAKSRREKGRIRKRRDTKRRSRWRRRRRRRRRLKRRTNIVSSLRVNFHLCFSQSPESKRILSFMIENLPNVSCMLLVQLRRVGVAASSVMWPTRTIHDWKFKWYGTMKLIWPIEIIKKMYYTVCVIYLGSFSKKSRKHTFQTDIFPYRWASSVSFRVWTFHFMLSAAVDIMAWPLLSR